MEQLIKPQHRIAVITLYGNRNYGNKLQNYAVQQAFVKRGCRVETIVCKDKSWRTVAKQFRQMLKFPDNVRTLKISEFNRDCITKKTLWRNGCRLMSADAKEYDFLAVGSDQVWNPLIRRNERDNLFLRFANRNQRICIAPSIGVTEIPVDCREDYIDGLQGFPYLNCREKSGAELITVLTGRRCEHLIDPTLSISADEWRAFERDVKIKNRFILMFFLGDIPSDAQKSAELLAKEQGLEIVCPSSIRSPYYAIDPRQFVYLIDKAKIVFTDSFHATAFSINMNTPFWVYNRFDRNTSTVSQMSSRITSLLEDTDLKSRYVSGDLSNVKEECSFKSAYIFLEKARADFERYLDRCLEQKNKKPLELPEGKCTGCTACCSACPTNCITMRTNSEGFSYPIVAWDKCVNCGRCIVACPVLNIQKPESEKIAYAAHHNDVDQLKRSSSGGVFPALASIILKNGGAVVGVCISDDLTVKHIMVSDARDLEQLRMSKYVQSEIGDVYKETQTLLQNNIDVLFSGTPCQIAGLKQFLGKEYEYLYTCDCACHGVPSPGLWKEWICEFEQANHCKVKSVVFRDQENVSWNNYNIRYLTDKGDIVVKRNEDAFVRSFQSNLSLRKSCHQCSFKGWNSQSDITLADFWGIDRICPEAKESAGTSMVLVHTLKGKAFIEKASGSIQLTPVESGRVEQVNMAIWKSVCAHKNRKEFFRCLKCESVQECVDKYATTKKTSITKRIIRKLKKVIVGKSKQ